MNERLLLGVTGSIAAYKAPYILRRLRERGFCVPVVLTEAAERFVGRVTFESLTSDGVYDDLWARREALSHISLLEGTELVLVAPATANIMAKAAHGIADDLLSSLLLAAHPARTMFAPAMNEGMWENPATQANFITLKNRGARFVEPGSGELACGIVGKGRLAEIEEIVLAAERAVRSHPSISGKKVVVTCGRTEEELDAVRVVTNRSSGRMGVELAKAFYRAGADVIIIAGQVSVPLPYGITSIRISSGTQMLAALKELEPSTDILLMAAAVADYAPLERSISKIKKQELTLNLSKTPDILASLENKNVLRIGFSVETGEGWEQSASEKLVSKRLDAVVANPARVIGREETEAVIVYPDGEKRKVPPTGKEELAAMLVEVVAELVVKKEQNGRS